MRHIVFSVVLALAACGAQPEKAAEQTTDAAAPVVASGPNPATLSAASIPLEPQPDAAANVARVIQLEREGAKLYSLVGGDPALNGEYVLLALFESPMEGWRTYRIGDFNSWDLVEQSAERVVLKVSHSAVDETSGEIVTAEQRLAIQLPAPGTTASSVQMTPLD